MRCARGVRGPVNPNGYGSRSLIKDERCDQDGPFQASIIRHRLA